MIYLVHTPMNKLSPRKVTGRVLVWISGSMYLWKSKWPTVSRQQSPMPSTKQLSALYGQQIMVRHYSLLLYELWSELLVSPLKKPYNSNGTL